MSDYTDYLHTLHNQILTPDEIIRSLTKEATRKDLLSKTRIIAGEANEVYDIELWDHEHVILRISRSETNPFEKENWAIKSCRIAGVPAPYVLLTKQVELKDETIYICIQQKLPGEPLERGNIDFSTFSTGQKQRIISQAGEILSIIHSIGTDGFGDLDADGKGEFDSYSSLLREHVDHSQQFMEMAEKIGFENNSMGKALSILDAFSRTSPNIPAVLNHNDFGPKHILLDGGEITGIIDFGEVCGNSPVNDLAKWDYWFSYLAPLEWLTNGYTNKSLFDDDFVRHLHTSRIHIGLDVLWWYFDQNYIKAIQQAKDKLYADITF